LLPMSDRTVKVFSFVEVNQLIAKVAILTEEVIQELDIIRRRNAPEEESNGSSVSDLILKEVEVALQEWSERIVELGGQPKGYFTVDFQSIDPEMLYCWNYGEDKIGYTHKVWENFSHRRPLTDSIDASGEHMKWVN
jgi:hypothetical protein